MRDLGVLLDTFQPLDDGHVHALQAMARQSRHLLVIILGPDRARTVHAPFTLEQRFEMIDAVAEIDGRDLVATAVPDRPADDPAWAQGITDAIGQRLDQLGLSRRNASVGLGCFRGRGQLARLLDMPQHWGWLDLGAAPIEIDGAHLRADYLRGGTAYGTRCPDGVREILDWFYGTSAYAGLAKDARAIARLQEQYGTGPFYAADAALMHGDRVLTIGRGNRPNRNARALPGGMIDKGEDALSAALRELDEEVLFEGSFTNADLPKLTVRATHEARHPMRDPRGHWITTAHLLRLPEDIPLPLVRGRSDAVRARFDPVSAIPADRWWADHQILLAQLLKLESR